MAKDLRGIPNQDVKRILSRIDDLAENPRGQGCLELSGQDRYRVRWGYYRIIYEIVDDRLVVVVVKVGSGVYQAGSQPEIGAPARNNAASHPSHGRKDGTFHQCLTAIASAADRTAENEVVEAKVL